MVEPSQSRQGTDVASQQDDSAGPREPRPESALLSLLVKLALVNALGLAAALYAAFAGRKGMLLADGGPVGGDFINLWTTARLLWEGTIATIYDPDAFQRYQQTFLGAPIGQRLWAYPPHSLLLAWPFELGGYFLSFAVWSLLGLAVLGFGARRFGFGRKECTVLLLSPAALCCIYYGQTGNIAAGLLLIALSARPGRDPSAVTAAALLTIKPQTGFLLPLVWIGQKRWGLVAAAALVTLAVVGLSVAVFGLQPWRDYLGLTAPALSALERSGSGPFMVMIPSLFMALRLEGIDGGIALALHAMFAGIVFLALLWRFFRTQDARRRTALALVATCLITPYMHMYDLTLLVVAGLLLLRNDPVPKGSRLVLVASAVAILWLAPYLVYTLGNLGMPIMPLLLVIAFLIV